MHLLQQLLFLVVLGVAGYLVYQRVTRLRGNILRGRADGPRTDRPNERLSTMLRIAFGQKKMFDRPVVGILHFILYVGFILINVELIEIIIDGVFGTHRIFAPLLGAAYAPLISFLEFLAVAVLVSVIVFLIRRNVKGVGVKRLHPDFHREMRGWPQLDGNLILVFEIVLMVAFLTLNATDLLLQDRQYGHFGETQTGTFLFSQFLTPLFAGLGTPALVVVERAAWWIHIVGILAFAVYVTYSKHLHILLAFPNTYFARLQPRGHMTNMPTVTQEVQSMLGLAEAPADDTNPDEVPSFGAKDVNDLSWKMVMDAYSCTECGRCTSVCPANLTGKKLSPRKIMMDVRDRAEEVGEQVAQGKAVGEDGKALLGDYTTKEELMACTTCNACVEACPILINPLDIILEQRRYIAMEEASTPNSWNAMFQNVENNFAPWAFAPTDRFNWADKLNAEASAEEKK